MKSTPINLHKCMIRLWMVCLIVGTGSLVNLDGRTVTAGQQDFDDPCRSQLIGMMQDATMDVQSTAPVFGCRQSNGGSWYMPPIATTRNIAITKQLDQAGMRLLFAVTQMAMDQSFSNSLLFVRQSSVVILPQNGKPLQRDISIEGLGTSQPWHNSVRNAYVDSMALYLSKTFATNEALVNYISWFIRRRDLALLAMTAPLHPLFQASTLDQWGYRQLPWPWQLADQAAIAAYTGQGQLNFG